jgi:hypothetical protein
MLSCVHIQHTAVVNKYIAWRFKENEEGDCGRQHKKYEKKPKGFLGAANTV